MNKLLSIAALFLALVSAPAFSGAFSKSGYGNTVVEACTQAKRNWEDSADYRCDDNGWIASGQDKTIYDTTSSFRDGKNHYKCDWRAVFVCNF